MSRVSSSSPSSTPAGSESQSQIVTHVFLQATNNVTNHIIHNVSNTETEDSESAPPIMKRPERTKSIVNLNQILK